jgi:hypothetical protein
MELDGDVDVRQVDAALAAAGLSTTGETAGYGMNTILGGVEHSYRPDEVCRHCGYPGPLDGVNEAGLCTDCDEHTSGVYHPGDDGPCKTCGAPHEGQPACDVFTQDQFAGATAFCPDCHWPQFDEQGTLGTGGPPYDAATATGMYDHD